MKDISFMGVATWLHPRDAAQKLVSSCHVSFAQAVDSLAMRLCANLIMASVARVAGHVPEDSDVEPSFLPQLVPPSLWESDLFRSAASSVWLTGDLSAFVPDGPIMFVGIRLCPAQVDEAIRAIAGYAEPVRAVPAAVQSAPMPISARPIASTWDWEGALCELIALADGIDGLAAIPGFDYPRRGSLARLEGWIGTHFVERYGKAPAESEIRKRAKSILAAIEVRSAKGLSTEIGGKT